MRFLPCKLFLLCVFFPAAIHAQTHRLSVFVTDGGRVASADNRILCSAPHATVCTGTYGGGERVTLTATPQTGRHVFAGWDGDCAGNTASTTVVLDANKNCHAVFGTRSGGALQVAAGRDYTCAVFGGSVHCWGYNEEGQLGDGTLSGRTTPTVVAGISDAAAVAAAHGEDSGHACAVLGNGGVRCWGNNLGGQLGDGTRVTRTTPTTVNGIGNAAAISAGDFHTCAVLKNGRVSCWGANDYGQLGDGSLTDRTTPVTVNGISAAVAVATGADHSCAALASGGVLCQGGNESGQLGDGTTDDREEPTAATGVSNAVAVAAGAFYTCAVLGNGGVSCWGYNESGQLGNGTADFNPYSTPAAIASISNAVAVAAGASHACAVLANGGVSCWGHNDHGQLGDGTQTRSTTPVEVVSISNAVDVTAGSSHTCAVLADGTMRCWGRGEEGQLGTGAVPAFHLTPTAVVLQLRALALGAPRDHIARVGALFNLTPPVAGGIPTRWEISQLPSWAKFSTATGTLYGIPPLSADGSTTTGIVITAHDATTSSTYGPLTITTLVPKPVDLRLRLFLEGPLQ